MTTDVYAKIRNYIDHNPIATLGTSNPDGTPHGSIIYICVDEQKPVVYFVTKQQTTKLQNIRSHDQVSLTIVNPSENSTLQANGRAAEVQDAVTIDAVMGLMVHKHAKAKRWLPPVTQLHAGAYEIVGVTLASARLTRFEGEVNVIEYNA